MWMLLKLTITAFAGAPPAALHVRRFGVPAAHGACASCFSVAFSSGERPPWGRRAVPRRFASSASAWSRRADGGNGSGVLQMHGCAAEHFSVAFGCALNMKWRVLPPPKAKQPLCQLGLDMPAGPPVWLSDTAAASHSSLDVMACAAPHVPAVFLV